MSLVAGDSTSATGGTVSIVSGAGSSSTASSLTMGTSATLKLGSVSSVSGAFYVKDSNSASKLTVDTGTADKTTVNTGLTLNGAFIGNVQYPVSAGAYCNIDLTLGIFIHIAGGADTSAANMDIRTASVPTAGMTLFVYNGYSQVSTLTFAGSITVNVGQMRMLVYLASIGWISPS